MKTKFILQFIINNKELWKKNLIKDVFIPFHAYRVTKCQLATFHDP